MRLTRALSRRGVKLLFQLVLPLTAGWAMALPAQGQTVSVAVAANFSAPAKIIAAQFAKDSGHEAQLSFGATGKFKAQISHGAPFEVFLSADSATPEALEAQGWAVPGTRFTYAMGQLVLWSADSRLVDEQGAVLRQPERFAHLALANPRLAPYGAAAEEVLRRLSLLEPWRPRFVQGENIAQTHQFVATGNAEMGLIALSQVMTQGRIASGSAWVVPGDLHAPIRQDAVLLVKGAANPAARAWLDYLQTPAARGVITAHGYQF
ncbi:MAG: molybdate ABC transporter substrate-binding protein [Magnetococcus sp. WYHC-3]